MYLNYPVLIPKVPGKITFQKKDKSNYVLYETGRRYDPNRQYTLVDRKNIGVQIPGRPEMMLPNENYLTYFPKGDENMTNEEKETIREYANEREYGMMLRDFFDQLFFEFQMQSRKKPNQIVNEYKVERLNRVLKPLMEIMQGEAYAALLEEIPMPEEREEDGQVFLIGLTYSDVALMMTQFKGAVNRFFQRR
jgi:hypothetical protein